MSTALTVVSDGSSLPAVLGPDLAAAIDSLGRRVAAIRYAHKLAGHALPTDAEGVKATMRGIRRTYGSARVRKAPAVAGKMLGMVARAPDKLSGLRDRALLLIGFGGALRRSELVALDVEDIQETETGLLVTIRGSKTDQERAGATIAIARGDVTCPARALREWLNAAGIEAGPIFRPIDKAGHSTELTAYLPISCHHRQGLCKTRRLRRQHVLRPFAPGRFSDLCGGQGRVDLQDDGRVTAQVCGYSAEHLHGECVDIWRMAGIDDFYRETVGPVKCRIRDIVDVNSVGGFSKARDHFWKTGVAEDMKPLC
jgi:hypothetical protein